MEPLTIGQKIGFACVVLFVLALTAAPFLTSKKSSSDKEAEVAAKTKNQSTMMASGR